MPSRQSGAPDLIFRVHFFIRKRRLNIDNQRLVWYNDLLIIYGKGAGVMSDTDRDDFWDIDKLVPKKTAPLSTFSTKEKLVDVEIDIEQPEAGDNAQSAESLRLTAPPPPSQRPAAREERAYSPERGLIKRVSVRHVPDKYDFHANFVKAAELYFDFKTAPCDFVSYYSYMPQYTQLTQAQKNYYFYWRSMVRRKKYIKTDYSYLYLYVYEIINLPDLIPPKQGLDMLIDAWCEYRKALPNIDANMALWVQDYCLVYQLECPMERIREFIFSVVGASGFKEFYLSDAETLGAEGAASVIAYLSDYDWRSGKFSGGENKEAYERHLTGAMSLLVSRLLLGGRILSEDWTPAKMERSAFRSALTTSAVKYRISVEYRPISEEAELRGIVTSALKYTENKLRALMGVKSRLAVKELPAEYRALIDEYFVELFDKVNRERQRANRPEYEKMYELQSNELSTADADEIERASWTTTARLVEDIDEYKDDSEPTTPADKTEESAADSGVETYGLDNARLRFIKAALDSSARDMHAVAAELGEIEDSLADEINEAFADGFGDVILEASDDGYTVIDDYKEEIETWLLKILK